MTAWCVADGVVVLRHALSHGSRWFTYEPDHNRWSRIDGVPRRRRRPAVGARVARLRDGRSDGSPVYDVHEVPLGAAARPIRSAPRLTQRRVTATRRAGRDRTRLDADPTTVARRRWCWPTCGTARTWRRLPATGQLDNTRSWTGTRMVDPDPTSRRRWRGGSLPARLSGRRASSIRRRVSGASCPSDSSRAWTAGASTRRRPLGRVVRPGLRHRDRPGRRPCPAPTAPPTSASPRSGPTARLLAFGGADVDAGLRRRRPHQPRLALHAVSPTRRHQALATGTPVA